MRKITFQDNGLTVEEPFKQLIEEIEARWNFTPEQAEAEAEAQIVRGWYAEVIQ